MTVVRQRIDVPIPRKRAGSATAHEKGLAKFYDLLYQTFLRHIPYWVPGANAQKKGARCKMLTKEMQRMPMEYVQRVMVCLPDRL